MQVLGILALLLIFLLAMPFFTKNIPEKFQQNLSQDLKQQGHDWVKISVKGRNVTLSGDAPNHEKSSAALKVAQQYAPMINIDNEMTPRIIQPYNIKMNWDGEELSLNGYLSNQEDKQNLLKIVRQSTTKNQLKDNIKLGAGAPQNWNQLVNSSLQELIKLQRGNVEITNHSIYFAGQTPYSSQRDAIKRQLAQFQQYQANLHIVAADEADKICQAKFTQLLSNASIKFAADSTVLNKSSAPLLTQLANTISLCPKAKIKITGYTDNMGNDKANLKLSVLRAKAVVNRLFQQGISQQQLSAIGQGESNPIADNETEAGRAANRRIEFIVGK